MAYLVQNHALDITLPHNQSEALILSVDSNQVPSHIHVPKQLTRDKLTKLLPDAWVSNYEKHHQGSHSSKPIQSSDPVY